MDNSTKHFKIVGGVSYGFEQTETSSDGVDLEKGGGDEGVGLTRPRSAHLQHNELDSYAPSSDRSQRYTLLEPPESPDDSNKPFHAIWQFITTSKCLAAITFLINTIALVIVASHPNANGRLTTKSALDAVSANILFAVLIRQELIVNLLCRVTTSLSPTTPLILRRHIAKFHHVGGLHKGCAFSAMIWYCAYVFLTTQAFVRRRVQDEHIGAFRALDLATCYLLIIFLSFICTTALSCARTVYHNTFERTHRFGGWAAVTAFWMHAGVNCTLTDDRLLYSQPSLWLLAAITMLLIVPWLRIRRVSITAKALSTNAIILTFSHIKMPPISTMRFSTSPLLEWHSFATLPDFPEPGKSSIVVADAGDWTRNIVANPPTSIWRRNPSTHNFLTAARMFNTVVVAATGAGIGPVLSYLSSLSESNLSTQTIRVLWCVRDPDADHWAFARDTIHRIDQTPRIFDTGGGHRPDIVRETRRLARIEAADAVFVVSNKKLTKALGNAVQADGVPAYGANFDS